MGQLIYWAATVTACNLDYLEISVSNHRIICYLVVPVAGLVFDYFFTLAFLRARPDAAALFNASLNSTRQFVGF